MTESVTPRTDAFEEEKGDDTSSYSSQYLEALGLSRQLERELAEAKLELEKTRLISANRLGEGVGCLYKLKQAEQRLSYIIRHSLRQQWRGFGASDRENYHWCLPYLEDAKTLIEALDTAIAQEKK